MGTRAIRNPKKVGMFDVKETIAAKIPISEMVIDEAYQGHVRKQLVENIASNWDSSAAGAIILNMRDDNSYAVLDGQHRVLAAKKIGVTDLNALVFVGKTREEEARLFVQLNTKHNVSALDRFRANLASGQVREKTIRSVLREVGLDIQTGPRKSPDQLQSAAALTRIYDAFGVAHLKATVGVLTSAFRDYPDRAKGYSQSALIGTAQVLFRYPEANVQRLIEKMRSKSPTTLVAMGDAKLDAHSDLWMGWSKMLVSLYNTGISSRNKGVYLDPSRMDSKRFTPKALARLQSPELKEKRIRTLREARARMTPEQRQEAIRKQQETRRAKQRLRESGGVELTVGVETPLRSSLAARTGKK